MSECIFCRLAAGELPCLKLYEDGRTLAFMDVADDVDGHILVIPKTHCTNVLDCDPETLDALFRSVQRVARHLTEDCGYDGVNLLNASGVSAGQSVPHFHIHIIPRKQFDGIDAWPVFTGAKQDREALYQRLKMTD